MPDGFAGGFAEGLQTADSHIQSQDQHALAGLAFQEGKQKIQMNQMEIDKTKMMLEQQKKIGERIAKLNGLSHDPNSTPPSPQDQAREQAKMHYDMSDAFIAGGLYEQGAKEAELASKLAVGASTIDKNTAVHNKSLAGTTASLMDWALQAKTEPEFQDRIRKSVMAFQSSTGETSPFANKQISRQDAEAIRKAATSRIDEANIAEKKAVEAKDYAEADAARRNAATREAQAREGVKRDEAKAKAGDKKQQAAADAKESALTDIETLRSMIDEDPNVVGVTGKIKGVTEFAKTKLGIGDQDTPEARFKTRLHGFKLNLQKAFATSGGRQLKAVYEQIDGMSDLLDKGTSAETANAKLDEIESMLTGKPNVRQGEIQRGSSSEAIPVEQWLNPTTKTEGAQAGGSPSNKPAVDKSTWDKRADGSEKGTGFLGLLKRPDGKVSSEISIGVEISGKEVEIPTLVPTLTKAEINYLLNNPVGEGNKIPKSIRDKAVAFARKRIAEGKSPFASDEESP